MLEGGLVEKVEAVQSSGVGLDDHRGSGKGYRQIGEYLLGERSLEEAVAEMRRSTRQFVRRPSNWFKADDPKIEWNEVTEELAGRNIPRHRSGRPADS